MKVTSHYFYNIMFVRRKSPDPTHTQEKRIAQEYEYQEWGPLVVILETFLSQKSCVTPLLGTIPSKSNAQ